MRRLLSRRPDPERRLFEHLERARVTTDPSWRDHATVEEQLAMWGQLLRMQVWLLVSDPELVSIFDIAGKSTGMAAFDEQVLRDWSGSDRSLQGQGTMQVDVPDCCNTMWSLGADRLTFRIDPRINEALFELDNDSLAWLGSGLVPWARAEGHSHPSDAMRSNLVAVLHGLAGVDQARFIGAFVSEQDAVECLELVVEEGMPYQDRVSIFRTVRERLETAERAVGRVALVVHQDHVILDQGVASWPVA